MHTSTIVDAMNALEACLPTTWFIKVLFPELCGPMIATTW